MRSIGSAQSSIAGSGSGGVIPLSHPGSANDFPRATTPIIEERFSRKTGRDLGTVCLSLVLNRKLPVLKLLLN